METLTDTCAMPWKLWKHWLIHDRSLITMETLTDTWPIPDNYGTINWYMCDALITMETLTDTWPIPDNYGTIDWYMCDALITMETLTDTWPIPDNYGNIVVVVFVFNVPPTAKVIRRRGHGLKSHPTDWWSRQSNLRPLVYKASGLSTTPWRLLWKHWLIHARCPDNYGNIDWYMHDAC